MGKLFVAIDFFYSATYGPDAPGLDYAYDRDHLYVVLQPFLVGGGHADSVKIREYFENWTGALLSNPGSFAVAGGANDFGGVPLTPVPFPPGTELALKLAWEPGARTWEARRTLGLWQAEGTALPADSTLLPAGAPVTDPLVLARTGWPDFAIQNFTNPLVGAWSHLTPAQRDAVLEWLVALISSLRQKEPASGTLARQVWDGFVHQPPRDSTDMAAWQAYLLPPTWQPGQPTPPAGKLFELLFTSAGPDNADLQPPRFHYGIDQLRAHPEVLLGDTATYRVTASTYHHRLWDSLRRFLDGGAASPEERERHTGDALGRLFGFGERLRWPSSTDPSADGLFMKLRQQAESLPGWCVSNVHSLLGQVFRVGPVEVDMTSAAVVELTLQGQPLLTGNVPGQTTPAGAPLSKASKFADDFVAFQRSARGRRNDGPSFQASVARDSGFTLFAPKSSEASTEAGHSPTGQPLYSVPGVLLDALEPERRTEMPADGDLLRAHPPRAALTATELFHPERLFPERITNQPAPSLFRPLLQLKVKIVPFPLTASDTPVYEVSLAGAAHPREASFLQSWMAALGQPGRAAALWISPASGAPVKPRQFLLNRSSVLRVETRGGESVAIIIDPQDQPEKLDVLLAAAPRTGGGDSRMDLVFESRAHRTQITADHEEPFNLLEDLSNLPADTPTIVLNRSVTHRVSLSADRLMERFGLTITPSPFVGTMAARNADPILDHAANFNKLRVELVASRGTISLNNPDALIPLPQNAGPPWKGSRSPQPTGPHFDYWLAHHFSQEVRDDAFIAETGRYLGYTSAGEKWRLTGHVEHQYSHRMPVEGQAPIVLPLSTDVIHLGNLTFRGRLASEPALLDSQLPENPEIPPPSRTALTFDHRKEPGGETLEISFRRKAFRLALERWNAGGSDRSTWLRELYGALADLRAALESGGIAEIVLERWNFDNTDPATLPGDDPREAFPSILRCMRRVEKGTFSLARLPQTEKAKLAEILDLLDLPFADFPARLAQLVGAGEPGEDVDREADSSWRTLTLPLARNSAGWTWTGTPGDPIFQTTDAVRAGLLLRRPARRVLPQAVGDGTLLPLEDQSPQLTGLPLQELKAQARKELQDYVSPTAVPPSPLYEAFSWLRSEDVDARATAMPPVNPADGLFDPKRHDQLFGEVSPFLNFPTGLRSPVPQVMDLYYVPYAFVPLKAHPLLGDGQTTLEFAQYLVSLLEDVAEGRPLGLKLETNPPSLPAAEALALRQRARDLIRGNGAPGPGVARRLLDLLDPVDDPHGLDDWPVEAEKDLFDKVRAHVARLESLPEDGLTAAQLELLAANPSLFTTSRAIAAGVFEPDTWTEQLCTLQLAKRIRDNLPESATAGLERSDWERFTYPQFRGRGRDRYFLDALEAGRYDDEIEIDQNVYLGIPPSDTSRLGEVRVLADHPIQRRGGAQARAAEDLIEQIHGFDATPKPGDPPPADSRRTIEANVVHYNPEWRVRKKDTGEIVSWSYLLPSRRFPAVPKPVLPSPAGISGEGHDSPWSSEFIPTFPDAGAIDLDTAFDAALTDVLERRKGLVELSSAASDGETIRARRLRADGRPALASADHDHRKGWHFIDSYLSHYYFVIEADEANQQVFDSLKNDAFEIEVEIWDRPLPPDAPREASKVEMKTPLQKWFVHYRSPRSPKPEVLPTAEAALEEIRAWLIEPREVAGLKIEDALLRRQVERTPVMAMLGVDANSPQRMGRTVVRFAYAGAAGWQLTPEIWETVPGNDIGGIMAVEVLERIDHAGTSIRGAYLLRVSVLDDPWHFTRVHMLVKRNDRDVDGNSNSDINPTFAMETEFSPWVSYGRQVLSLGPEDLERYRLPAAVRRLDVKGGGQVVSLEDWLKEAADNTVSFGPIVLQAVVETRFTDSQGQDHPFWNVDEAQNEHRKVSGIVLQILEDMAPRKSLTGAPRPVAERRDLLARQHLAQKPASDLGALTLAIRRDLVRTATPLLRVSWFNAAGEMLMEVTWPVEIQRA